MIETLEISNAQSVRRCAIYTRKSHEDGLEQEFNSLDAQREAGEAFIKSQTARGWRLLDDRYDDGGFSGGNMQRPALKRLLADVDEGRIDTLVVYKIDRLSRSLPDFFQMIELFEARGVSFVSVTEQFNTTDSSGRLMLGILMSFAQYEREISAERIRHKVAAAKRRGKWCGGVPPLGYQVDSENQRLVVDEQEAQLVQRIFRRFLQTNSSLQVVRELNEQGCRTKSWVTKKGDRREGKPWDVGYLYRLLHNRTYQGEVRHKEKVYPGEHEAIVDATTWERARALLEENCRTRQGMRKNTTDALLRGLIRCGHCNSAMGPTYTNLHGRRYLYYLCVTASKRGADVCPVSRVAAGEIEKAVFEQLGAVFRSSTLVARTFLAAQSQETEERGRLSFRQTELKRDLEKVRQEALAAVQGSGDGLDRLESLNVRAAQLGQQLDEVERALNALGPNPVTEHDVVEAFGTLEQFWDVLFPSERHRIIQLLVARVTVWPDGLDIKIQTQGLAALVVELTAYAEEARERSMSA